MDKTKLYKMLSIIEEYANTHWSAMYQTYYYKKSVEILAKPEEETTLGERELLGNNLHALCLAMGLNYYRLIQQVCQR